jgi:serine/threonine-protein kinase
MDSNSTTNIGRYRITAVLGQGGMGIVYKAEDSEIRRQVAIKMILASMVNSDLVDRFYDEVRVTANLHHPNIVTVYDWGKEKGNPYIVMEFLDGISLDKGRITAKNPQLALYHQLGVLIQVCAGLQYAHNHGVIHRDVKPANIVVLDDRTVKLVDFGIARLIDDQTRRSGVTRDGQVIGSLDYMSPEQLEGKPIDHRSDVYSSGVVLYHLLTETLPFRGVDTASTVAKILHSKPRPLSDYMSVYPAELDEIFSRVLAKSRGDRFQSADEFELELTSVQSKLKRSFATDYITKAEACIERSDWDNAKGHLLELLTIDRGHERANELLREIQQILRRDRRIAEARELMSQAEQAAAQRQYDDALSLMEQAIQLDNTDLGLRMFRDQVREAKERHDKSLRALARAQSLLEAEELDDALIAVSEALALEPDQTRARELRHLITNKVTDRSRRHQFATLIEEIRKEIAARRFTSALELFRRASLIEPSSAELQELNRLALAGKEQERRRTELQRISIEARELASQKQFDLALKRVSHARQAYPEEPAVHQLQQEIEELRSADEYRTRVSNQLRSAYQLIDSGDFVSAVKLLEVAVDESPNDPDLKAALEQAQAFKALKQKDQEAELERIREAEVQKQQYEAELERKRREAEAYRLQMEAQFEAERRETELEIQRKEAELEKQRQEADAQRLKQEAEILRKQREARVEAERKAAELERQRRDAEARRREQDAEIQRKQREAQLERERQEAELERQRRDLEARRLEQEALFERQRREDLLQRERQEAEAKLRYEKEEATRKWTPEPPLESRVTVDPAGSSDATQAEPAASPVDATRAYKVESESRAGPRRSAAEEVKGERWAGLSLRSLTAAGFVILLATGAFLAKRWMDHRPPPAPKQFEIMIESDPPHALVHIKGSNLTCETPCSDLKLAPGSYEIEATLENYQTMTQAVKVPNQARVRFDLNPMPLPEKGVEPVPTISMLIHTMVGAIVTVDDKQYRTKNDGTLEVNVAGNSTHTIRVQKEGFKAREQVVRVGGDNVSLSLALSPDLVTVLIRKAPPGARVLVDEKPQATVAKDGTAKFQLSTGEHAFALSTPNGTAAAISRSVKTGQSLVLDDLPIPVPVKPSMDAAESEWDKVKDSNSTAELQSFIDHHPTGSQAELARLKIDQLDGTRALSAGSRTMLQDYLTRHPNGQSVDQCRSALDELDWKAVENSNDPGKLQEFIDSHGNSKFKDQALAKIADIRKSTVSRETDLRKSTVPRETDDEGSIRTVLNTYAGAIQDRNRLRLRRIYPGLDDKTFDRMRESFANAESIKVELKITKGPIIEANGTTAHVSCDQLVEVKVHGSTQSLPRTTLTFTLAKDNGEWFIDRVTSER